MGRSWAASVEGLGPSSWRTLTKLLAWAIGVRGVFAPYGVVVIVVLTIGLVSVGTGV